MVERLLSLPQALSSAGCARRAVHEMLAPLGASDDEIASVQAVASELVANGVLHGASEIDFVIRAEGRTVRVAAVDRGGGEPVALEPPSHADRGRGLLVVAGLATLWGVAHHETRKMVWAEMDLREPISVGQAAD